MAIDEICRLEQDDRNKKRAHITCRVVLKWLSSDNSEGTHERYFNKRFENTGQWLLDDPCFINWRDEAQSSLLWCYGARKSQSYTTCICIYINLDIVAGAGKTILTYGYYELKIVKSITC